MVDLQEKVLKGSRSVFQQLSTNVDVDNSCRPLYFHPEKKAMAHRKRSHQMPQPLSQSHTLLLHETPKKNGELPGVLVRAALLSIQSLPSYLSHTTDSCYHLLRLCELCSHQKPETAKMITLNCENQLQMAHKSQVQFHEDRGKNF